MTTELMAAVESLGRAVAARTDVPAHILIGNPGPDQSWVRDRFDNSTGPQFTAQHHPRREGDEWACGCGARWGVGEAAPAGHADGA